MTSDDQCCVGLVASWIALKIMYKISLKRHVCIFSKRTLFLSKKSEKKENLFFLFMRAICLTWDLKKPMKRRQALPRGPRHRATAKKRASEDVERSRTKQWSCAMKNRRTFVPIQKKIGIATKRSVCHKAQLCQAFTKIVCRKCATSGLHIKY